MRLDPESVQAVALAVVALLRGRELSRADGWLAPSEVALRFGVSRTWVYAHARELGAVRLGSGPKARLRFNAAQVELALAGNAKDEVATRKGKSAAANARRVVAEHDLRADLAELPDAWREAAQRAAER